jgi:hypothetical protein
MHHTGSQEETPVMKLKNPEGRILQEVPGDEEQDVEIPKCTDHQLRERQAPEHFTPYGL